MMAARGLSGKTKDRGGRAFTIMPAFREALLDNVAFIDLEASGLGPQSWPIEVGWCFKSGAPEAHLIAPASEWAREAWDQEAEALHGIALASLSKTGAAPASVCARLNRALKGAVVYSDAPDWDGFWLYRLFAAAGVKQGFSLVNFADLFDGLGAAELQALLARASRTSPHRHRAREDVLHMRRVYELAKDAAA